MARSSIFIIPEVTGVETTEDSPSVSFDAVTSFDPTKSRNISKSPITRGSFVSEILSDNGGVVTMEAYVSNSPIFINSNNLISSNTPEGRAQAAYLALDKIYKSKNTVTLVHRFDTLTSYMLTSFAPILMPSEAIGFRLQFEEVRFASEQRVKLVLNMSADKTKDSAKASNNGITSKTVASETEGSLFIKLLGETVDTVTIPNGDLQ